MGYGKLVRKYRTQAGLKLAELSLLAEVDVGTISALEQRDSSRSDFFPQLAKALGLTFEQFIDPAFAGRVVAVRDPETGQVLRVQLESADTPPRPAAPPSPGATFEAITEEEQRLLDNFREIATDEEAARELFEMVETKAARMRAMKERWLKQAGLPVPPARHHADAQKTEIARAALDVTEQMRQRSLLDDEPKKDDK